MFTGRDSATPAHGRRRVDELLGQIRALALELDSLRGAGLRTRELEAKERQLDRLQWRLAAVVRRSAAD